MVPPPIHEQKYENIFVLGAGFSKAVGDSMPLMNDLSREIEKQISNEQIKALKLESFFKGEHLNFELLLSHLNSASPWKTQAEAYEHRAMFSHISQIIAAHIGIQEAQALASGIPMWLQKLIMFFDVRQSPVITFNYDTIVERAALARKDLENEFDIHFPNNIYCACLYPKTMQDIRVFNPHARPPDGTGRRTFELIKLHGSINWLYSGTDSFPGEQIYFFEREKESPLSDYEKIEVYAHGRKELIIPPVSEKTTFYSNTLIRTLWADAKHVLSKADNIYFIGYSMPETDLTFRNLLMTAIDPDTHIHIVNRGNVTDPDKVSLVARYQESIPQVNMTNFHFDFINDEWAMLLTQHLLGGDPLQWSGAPPPTKEALLKNTTKHAELIKRWNS